MLQDEKSQTQQSRPNKGGPYLHQTIFYRQDFQEVKKTLNLVDCFKTETDFFFVEDKT